MIFVPDEQNKTHRWIKRKRAVWAGPNAMASKVAIQRLYPRLGKFFQAQLEIPDAGPEVFVEELETIARQFDNKVITEHLRDRIWGLLQYMSYAMEKDLDPWLRQLSETAIFPVRSPSGKLELYAADEDFYIPGKSGKFASIFASDIFTLSTPRDSLLADIQPILESPVFSARLQDLGRSVTEKLNPQGVEKFHRAKSEKYASIRPFVER
jgi:hypothetical protein